MNSSHEPSADPLAPTTAYRDAAGKPTADPERAVTGEIVERDERGAETRTWFFVRKVELPWLPVSEAAFLLWVLALLLLAWFVVALILLL